MEQYKNLNGNSGVDGYEIKSDSITVTFNDGGSYIYNYASAGTHVIEEMKKLAVKGSGLNSYINKRARKAYARKIT